MSGTRRGIGALVGLLVVAAACVTTDPTPTSRNADPTSAVTLVINAKIYTVDPDQSWVDAFAFDANGVIIAVGTESNVLAVVGDNTAVIDADGNMILPGFQDPHVHVPEAGINAGLCIVSGRDLGLLEAQARECASRQAGAEWVRAVGASLFDLRDTEELPIDVLDRAIPDRPALILDDAVWTNTLGLEASGIGPDDPDPQGGVLHRDPITDRLTGLLFEDAQQLVRNAAAGDDESNYQGLLNALEDLASSG